jgi:homoserine dehydrogenase
MSVAKEIGVLLVGCGKVGGATAQVLVNQRQHLRERIGADLALRAIVDIDFAHARRLGLEKSLFCRDLSAALARPDVQVVVELVGGTTAARQIATGALEAGKSLVTANKALLAHHGAELWGLARRRGTCIAFEASCAGAVPIIAALTGELAADRVEAIYGIVNGTCNHILTAMTEQNQSYADALRDAQRRGLAEADPTLDVSGTDSAHKLTILASLAFARRVDLGKVYVEGIDRLQLQDIRYGQELGYVVKLLAIAQGQQEGLSLRVHPAFISTRHPLAWVSGPFNAISVYAENSGHTMYYGPGAGRPTVAAVIGDLASVALGNARRQFESLGVWPDRNPAASQLDLDAVRCRYYLRMQVADQPGVLAGIARIFGRRDISISSVLQHEPTGDAAVEGVPVVITTHDALEGNVRQALKELNRLESVKADCVCIRMVEE